MNSYKALLTSGVFLFCWLPTDGSWSDQILAVPLFEVGGLWVRATLDMGRRILDVVFSLPDFSYPWTYAFILIILVGFYYFGSLLFSPINRIRSLGDVGYILDGKMTTKDMVNALRKRRQVGDVPPVYPNGWFAVIESRALKSGEVKNVGCLGKNLAVFRGKDGCSHVLDAYCPHMGANMAAGGIVKGSCLECPFHGWQFRGDDGKCTRIPYCEDKHIPDVARVKSYTSLERNGFIFMWFHAEGNEPDWEPPLIEEIDKGEWSYRGRSEHVVNAHIEEIPENGSDIAHLGQVHGPIMTAGIDLRYTYNKLWSFAKHDWNGEWSPDSDPENKHVGIMLLSHTIRLFGWRFPILDVMVTARQIGPGIVHLAFDSPLFGKGTFLQTLTPVEPLIQRMIHHVYINNYVPTFVAKFFLYSEALMVERDIMIWNNKRYVVKPIFVKSKEDSLVARHRRWYSQFYSENSPRIQFQSNSIDW